MLTLGIGIAIGVALSCTASNIAMSVTSRTVAPSRRSVAMGAVSACGSIGLMLAAPLAQALLTSHGWQVALGAFLVLAAVMLPAAWMAGAADRITSTTAATCNRSAQAVREATGHTGYIVMAIAFFVCGLQLVFLTTHLPTYLEICGMDPGLGAQALAMIGLFNVGGSYLFGWLGGRYSKRGLLGGIYVLRSLFMVAYFVVPPTPASTLVFAAAMGTLWLGVVPLVNGLVVHLFGLRYMATLSGIAFFSHQLGSFVGAYGGGLIYSALGSYEWAWKGAVAIGIARRTVPDDDERAAIGAGPRRARRPRQPDAARRRRLTGSRRRPRAGPDKPPAGSRRRRAKSELPRPFVRFCPTPTMNPIQLLKTPLSPWRCSSRCSRTRRRRRLRLVSAFAENSST